MASHGDRFSGLAHLEDQEDGETAKLLTPLSYTTKDGWLITVPTGEFTDFASIPRLLWTLIPPRGVYNRPAMIHDYLYKHAPFDQFLKRCSRGRADSILKEACENCDDRSSQRWMIYWGVRSGGWKPWNRYRAESA